MPPYESQQPSIPLIGKIFEAAVISRHLDSCDFRLDDGERVRLYQYDSCAADDKQLMHDLPQYSERQTCRFMITHRRMDSKGVLYYANERWAVDNPWENLPLKYGDRVQGKVIRSVHGEQNILKGYLVQLDPRLHIDNNPNQPQQPDIQIYLPVSELPWDDGSMGQKPRQGVFRRLMLEKDDQLQLSIITINCLPRYPEGSLIECMQHQNNQFWENAKRIGWGAHIKEQLHKQYLQQPIPSSPEEIFRLDHCCILLIDDQDDSLIRLKQALEGNGATVHTILARPPLLASELIRQILAQIQQHKPDVVLIDNALPQTHDGLALSKKILAVRQENAATPFPSVALISNHFLPEDIQHIQQEAPNLHGALLRPITPDQVISLCRQENVWSEGTKILHDSKTPDQQTDIRAYYMKLVWEGFADSAIVLGLEQGQWRWEHGEGELPFRSAELTRTLQESDLHLLLDKRLPELRILRDENHDTRLLGSTLREARWFSILSTEGAVIKIIGLSWRSIGHQKLASALQDNIREKHANQTWQAWIQHNANLISSGLTIHSLIHEYRQYLNQLQTGMDTLQLGIKVHRLDMIETTTERLSKTMHTMQELENILLKGQAQRTSPVHIPDVLDTVEALLRPYAKETHVDFRIINKPKLSLGIAAASITIPLSNLLSNAFKHHFLATERKVSIVIQIQYDDGKYWLEFQVQDNGGGIPTHQLNQLFQAGASFAHDPDEQHGIGLWLARAIARQAGGDVLLTQNWRGLGCCFTLRIPQALG